ncbi:MarR family EPS-associated transcriptional regulator [Thermodesulfobacteriota bacterium]
MNLSSKDFQVLDALDQREITTQRQLSEHTDISLGQINYVVKRLLEKGLIKLGNFRKNPRKIGYAYLLTPKGIEAKSKLAVNFVMSKLREHNDLRQRLAERLKSIQRKGHHRIIFVGPSIVRDFIVSIIEDNNMGIALVAFYTNFNDIENRDSGSYDMVLLFDSNTDNFKRVPGIPKNKIFSLW